LILAVRSANGAAAAGVALDVTIKGEPPLRRLITGTREDATVHARSKIDQWIKMHPTQKR
jgi:hypothetical protein